VTELIKRAPSRTGLACHLGKFVRAEQDDRHHRDDEELGGIEVEHRSSLYDSHLVLGALTEVSGVDIGEARRNHR
jgi:hypothetical protein